jgi:hypothetical protein
MTDGISGVRMSRDKRVQHRFRVKEGALAGFLTKDMVTFAEMGDILDISTSGLSFHYAVTKEQAERISSELEIFAYQGPLVYLNKIPCKIVYELSDPFECGLDIKTRRCGVQFGELSKNQVYQLQFLIENYAAGEADRNQDVALGKSSHALAQDDIPLRVLPKGFPR